MKLKPVLMFILIVFCVVAISGCLDPEEKEGKVSKSNISEEEEFSGKGEKGEAVAEASVEPEAVRKDKTAAEIKEKAMYRPEFPITSPIISPVPRILYRLEPIGYEKYPSSEDPVFEEVEFDKNSLHFSEIFNDFDTVTASPEAFQKAAADGTLKLYLRGQVFELEFDEVETSIPKTIMENENGFYTVEGAPISNYRGKVADIEDSRVLITSGENVLLGNIDIGYTTSYCIEQTNQTLNGKVIHVIYSSADYRLRKFTEYNEL